MSIIKLKKLGIKTYPAFIIMLAIVVLQSCTTTKYNFSTSRVVPAAEGTVKVKKDKNNNYNIELHVNRLAEPNRT